MRVRTLGLRVQEAEVGPYTFLLVDSQPIAYKDRRATGGIYRTNKRFNKAATRAQNKWLHRRQYAIVPHQDIVSAWASATHFGHEAPAAPERREVPMGRREGDRKINELLDHVRKAG